MTLEMNIGPIDASQRPIFADQSAGRHRSGYTLADTLVTITRPTEPVAEAVRSLRTHVISQHFAKGRRGLSVCSASAGAGCTFVAANLAVALSQAGLNTLLLDADLRRPGVQDFIRPPEMPMGLRETLQSPGHDYLDALQTDVAPNLSVMFAGGPAGHAQELLAGDRFRSLMDYCLREYDATIVDTPPANRYSDVSRVANVVGYSIVVARRDVSLVQDVRILVDQLKSNDATVIGTVFNES